MVLDDSVSLSIHTISLVGSNARGNLASIIFLSNICSYDREETFSAINLTVCAGDLLEAIRQYTREEVLDGDNAYFCERCQMKQRALKRLTFNSLPPVLCLQLKRFGFDWERQVAVKSNQAFSFPRRLDMTPFVGDTTVIVSSFYFVNLNFYSLLIFYRIL